MLSGELESSSAMSVSQIGVRMLSNTHQNAIQTKKRELIGSVDRLAD